MKKQIAFVIKGVDLAIHAPWIELLLTEYYDPRYQFALQQQNRKPLHRGNYSSCLEFLKNDPCAYFPKE